MTLTELKREAEQSITWRKHIMAEWIDSRYENRETSIMTLARKLARILLGDEVSTYCLRGVVAIYPAP